MTKKELKEQLKDAEFLIGMLETLIISVKTSGTPDVVVNFTEDELKEYKDKWKRKGREKSDDVKYIRQAYVAAMIKQLLEENQTQRDDLEKAADDLEKAADGLERAFDTIKGLKQAGEEG